MKLLLDACVWGGARSELARAGHDAEWAGEWDHDPGDEAILDRAKAEGRTLVTLDKDFGELAIVRKRTHAGIVRLSGIRSRDQAARLIDVLRLHGEELTAGAIVTVEPARTRVRSPG